MGIVVGRHALLPFLFCPDVSRLRGDVVDPVRFGTLLEQDSQLVLPTLIVQHMPMVAQVLFFGAVGGLERERHQADAVAIERFRVFSSDACGLGGVCCDGLGDCTLVRCQYLQAGREYLQGDAGGGVHSSVRGALLETSHYLGCALGHCGGSHELAGTRRLRFAGCHMAAELVGFQAEGVCPIAASLWPSQSSGARQAVGPPLLLQCEAHETADFFNREGFLDDVPCAKEFGDVQKTPGVCRTAHGHDIGLHEFPRQREGDLHPIPFRHEDVSNHQIGLVLAIHREGDLSIGRFADLMAVLFQDAAQECSNGCVIVND